MPASDAVRAFADRLNLGGRLESFADRRWRAGGPRRPVLHIEDVSAIPLLTEIAGVEEYQHRARVRARTGDLYATATPPDPDYETYCRKRLGFGDVRRLDAAGEENPLAVARGCGAAGAFARLADAARTSDGLVLHPYMSIDDVWDLAARLAEDAAVPVTVLGPPPPVTWAANDKACFTDLVERVLGPGWTPETCAAATPRECADLLRRLAGRHAQVGLKRTRCASGVGNVVFDAARLRAQTPAETEASVRKFLARTGGLAGEPVLAVAWEPASASPSTQWWIPPPADGPPRLDGICEQILEGPRRVFVGSRPSTLPGRVNRTLTGAGRRVAEALQTLGYVGRCSFDHLVLGEPEGDFTVRFTECNGRWGGASTPMHLVDRVVTGPRPPYRAQDFMHERLRSASFGELLDQVGGDAFDVDTQQGRYLFYNVGPLAACGKLDVIALGATQAEAEQALLADLPRLLGL